MTNDLISRQALTAEIMRRGIYPPGVRHAIENAPAIDAIPVVHGKWIPEDAIHKCTECGFGMFMNMGYYFMDGECIFSGGETFMHNYCPNCGAKMDKEDWQ